MEDEYWSVILPLGHISSLWMHFEISKSSRLS